METKIFAVTFLSDTSTYRQVCGKQAVSNETLADFIKNRAIPLLRENPMSSEELIGGYKICVGSELIVTSALQEPNIETKTIEVNKMNDPIFALKYLRDTYCTKKEKETFNHIIEKLEKSNKK